MYAHSPHTAIVATSMDMNLLPYARMNEEAKEMS